MSQMQEFSEIVTAILCFPWYIWAICRFCKRYLEISGRREALFVIFLSGSRIMLYGLNRWLHVPYIVLALASHICYIGLVLALFYADREKKLLVASIVTAAITMTTNFCESFLSCAALLLLSVIKNNSNPFLGIWESCLISCIKSIAVIVVMNWLSGRLDLVFYGKPGMWYLFVSVPLLVMTVIIDVVNWGADNGIMVQSRENESLYYDQLFSHGGICILAVLSIFAAGSYVFGMNKIYLEQRKSAQYHAQITAYRMLEEQYGQSERVRHDMKNHVIALLGLLETRELDKMKDYLKRMEDDGGFSICEDVTGNHVIDALLYQKRKLAKEKGIVWECEVQISEICGIYEYDLCVLFGNLLDNAIEACEKMGSGEYRFVRIQSGIVKKFFLLEVTNSTHMQEQGEIDDAKKRVSGKHGIGLLNIRDMVNRYHGSMEIEIQKGSFLISILLPLKEEKQNKEVIV